MCADIHYGQEQVAPLKGPNTDERDQSSPNQSHPACNTRPVHTEVPNRDIAAAFLARDESQLEYYEKITKDMPGKVLVKHGIVERDCDQYRLTIDPSSLSAEERDELIRLCDAAINSYLQKRGASVYDHRRAALGY